MRVAQTSLFFLFAFAVLFSNAQCIDESLINLDMMCIDIWDPVCGCDNVTYPNDCHATNFGGVTSFTAGECQSPAPGDCLDLTNVDFGLCDMFMGVAVINGACSFVSGCGWVVEGVDYSPYFFDNMDECTQACGTATSECLDLEGVDFGDCDAVLGVAVVSGQCVFVSGCDFFAGGVDYSNNFFTDIASCESQCETLLCINTSLIEPVPFMCGEMLNPVCGCNGVTYPNPCTAEKQHGVTSFTPGPCSCPDESLIEPSGYNDCLTIMAEVCGCDDVDYSDPCYAYFMAGVATTTLGPCSTIGIGEKETNVLRIFPNPTNADLTIQLAHNALYVVRVYDLGGRMIYETKLNGSSMRLTEATAWPAGCYLIEVIEEHEAPLRSRLLKE